MVIRRPHSVLCFRCSCTNRASHVQQCQFPLFPYAHMYVCIHSIECDLEGRFSRIRTGETNLGNLVTDIMRRATRSDIALLNSGTFRSDSVHQAGKFRVKVSYAHIQYMYMYIHVYMHICSTRNTVIQQMCCI